MENDKLLLSSSVNSVIQEDEKTTSVSIAKRLLKIHPDYGSGLATEVKLEDDPTQAEIRIVEEWLADIRSLYDEEKAPLLDGRLVIYGLSLLDPYLQRQLLDAEFIEPLKKEIDGLDEILTKKGNN